MPLEKVGDIDKQKVSTFNIIDVLGQFLRFMHMILICSLQEQSKKANMYPTNPHLNQNVNLINSDFFDRQTYIQIVKVMQTLIFITPYHLMNEGLATVIIKALIYNLSVLDKVNNRD